MLALEAASNVVFSDHMLARSVFGSVACISTAVRELQGA
jgi:hypothetical protein